MVNSGDVGAGQRKEWAKFRGAEGPPLSQSDQEKLWRGHLPVLAGVPAWGTKPYSAQGGGGGGEFAS